MHILFSISIKYRVEAARIESLHGLIQFIFSNIQIIINLLLLIHRISRTSVSLSLWLYCGCSCRPVEVRPVVAPDRLAVSDLVKGLRLNESLLQDLDHFYETRRDLVS